MAERIYVMDAEDRLEPLEAEPFSTEDALQKLLAEHPELLDGEQMWPGDPRRWILVKREQGIPDTAGAAARWSLDLLVIDQDATPTLVEVKRGANPEVRRHVVGQMLVYAAHAPQVTADELRRTFEENEPDAEERLADLLGDGERDADEFWDEVARNLRAKKLRLLFVADSIPDELRQVVEFLNEQMPNVEVLAVEIKQFRGKGESTTQTFVPRVIGRLAAPPGRGTSGSRRKLTPEELLDSLPDQGARDAVTRLFTVAEECGARLEEMASSVSIRMGCSIWKHPITVAWIFEPGKSGPVPRGGKNITFGPAVLSYPNPPAGELLATFGQWADLLEKDVFTKEEVGLPPVKSWAITYEEAAVHIDLLEERLRDFLTKLKKL